MTTASNITAPTAVYRFFSHDGELLYVGVTDSLGTRWRKHSKNKPWWNEVADTRIAWLDTRAEALAEETHAIKQERPKYNVVHAGQARLRPLVEHTPEQVAALNEIDQVAEARNELEQEASRLDDRERAAIEAAWRDNVPPTEIAMLVGRSPAYVRKLRPADVPPARLGGGAALTVKRQSEQH